MMFPAFFAATRRFLTTLGGSKNFTDSLSSSGSSWKVGPPTDEDMAGSFPPFGRSIANFHGAWEMVNREVQEASHGVIATGRDAGA
jgi:hypothetical protein